MDICDLYTSTLGMERAEHKVQTEFTNIFINRDIGSVLSVYMSHLLRLLRSHEEPACGAINTIELANDSIFAQDTLTITPSKHRTKLLWSDKFKNLCGSVIRVPAAEEYH